MNIPLVRLHKPVYRTTWLMNMRNFASDASDNRKAPITDWLSDDYQLLHHSVLPTMHFQKSLLRLPIPDLNKTCSRYLRSQKALLNEMEYRETEKTVEDFRINLGPPLQKQLQEWDKNNKHTSYISKLWFDMYLSDRAPVVLNYNPFMTLLPPEPPNTNQLVRATNLLVSSARFLRTLREGVLEPEVYHLFPAKSDTEFFRKVAGWAPQMFASVVGYALKAFPLDMSQFGNLFNSTRVPRLGCDTLHCDKSAKHVLVMRNGNFYVFDILDENGRVYPPSHLHACMAYVAADTTPRPAHPLGYLTTENRDTWAMVREELSSAGNTASLRALDYAAFNLVLDDAIVGQDPEACFSTFLYGDGGNRWFDKSFSVILTKDAMAALNFEHSWGDGVAVMRYFNEVVRDMQRHSFVTDTAIKADTDPASCVKILEFNIPDSVAAAVDAARHRYEAATSALAVHVFESDVMNKNFCKKHGVSPDAIMQLGFQLTYRLHTDDVAATYESCSTSAFKHGRTETLRPATLETKAFSDAVCRGTDLHQLREMILQCSKVHGELTKQAAMGQGFDRHLFGLRKLAEQQSTALPALYQDPAYAKINHNILSTSTLPSNLISLGGFGPVVQDGFGVGYQIQDDRLGILLSSYPPHRDGQGFVNCASKAYTTIRDALTVK